MGWIRRHKVVLAGFLVAAIVASALANGLVRLPERMAQLIDPVLGPLVICTAGGAQGAVPGDDGSHQRSPHEH